MSNERLKMLAGEMYDPFDPELVAGRERARDLCQDLNATREAHQEERRRILSELFGRGGDTVWMQPPFFCDYGSNIELGERVFFNFNCIVLDVCPVQDRQLFAVWAGGADLHPDAPVQRDGAPTQGVRQARRHRLGRVGRRRRHHPSGSAHRIRRRHRGGQRRHAGRSRSHVCGRQSVPGDSRDHRSLRPPTTFLRSSYRSDRTPPACSS